MLFCASSPRSHSPRFTNSSSPAERAAAREGGALFFVFRGAAGAGGGSGAGNLDAASSLVDEIVRLNPESVRHHQKRVEYAFKRNERGTLIEAYLQLADALFRAGSLEKSRAIYQRVLDLAPDDLRAQAALEAFPAPEPPPAAAAPLKTKNNAPPARHWK